MKIIFWGKGKRGLSCLESLIKLNIQISALVVHPEDGDKSGFVDLCRNLKIAIFSPEDPNSDGFADILSTYGPDLFILAGYGKILKQKIIAIPRIMCINLHGGKLPEYRGSSPLNWALINGDKSFSLSIIRLDNGVDTGDILDEQNFPITDDMTINDLHNIANRVFPEMLVKVILMMENNTLAPRKQNIENAGYYPLRFPDDGLIIWDIYTAEQINNRIRALTDPYPGAFTFFNGRKIKLISSKLYNGNYYGEPGRIYLKSPHNGLLVCASDKCLWIDKTSLECGDQSLYDIVKRYDKLTTLREAVAQISQRNYSNENRRT